MASIVGDFTTATRIITELQESLRQCNQSAEQIAMEREAKAEQQRLAKMVAPYSNDRR